MKEPGLVPWPQGPQVSKTYLENTNGGMRQLQEEGTPGFIWFILDSWCSGQEPGAVATGTECGFRHHPHGEESAGLSLTPANQGIHLYPSFSSSYFFPLMQRILTLEELSIPLPLYK